LKKSLVQLPLVYPLPFHRIKFIARINNFLIIKSAAWLIKLLYYQPDKLLLLWVASSFTGKAIGKFNEGFCLYDCFDYYSSADPKEDQIRKEEEKALIKKVEIVFANSPALYRLKKPLHRRVFQVPQGANVQTFFDPPKQKEPADLKNIPHPRIGFAGNNDYRVNLKLVIQLAKKRPDWSFCFLGRTLFDRQQDKVTKFPILLEELKKLKNVHLLGFRETKEELVAYLDHFDTLWIPYDTTQEFVRYCYPMKVFEYFARGKPVVSTPIESLIPLQPYVTTVKDAKEAEQKIKTLLRKPWPKKYIQEQRQLVLDNSWQAKIEAISRILKKEFPEKFQ
jgi:glycosyltransferase involved in cell wall biosynthesis